jgi:hypothetical protein
VGQDLFITSKVKLGLDIMVSTIGLAVTKSTLGIGLRVAKTMLKFCGKLLFRSEK